MAHPWNSDPELGWSTLAVSDGDRGAAEHLADELAELCWQRRHHAPPPFLGPSEAIAAARGAWLARRFGCVTIADVSDVVTAGGPGDSTHLLRALLTEAQGLLTYAALRDPAAIAVLWPHVIGERVALAIGATLDPARSSPLPVTGEIVGKYDRHGFGKTVVFAVEHLRIVITEGPALAMRPAFYRDVGLPPWRADIVVVKNFFPFLLYFLPYNRKTLFVRTQGVTDFDAAFTLAFDGPMHPRDPVDDWRLRDRVRRGLAEGSIENGPLAVRALRAGEAPRSDGDTN